MNRLLTSTDNPESENRLDRRTEIPYLSDPRPGQTRMSRSVHLLPDSHAPEAPHRHGEPQSDPAVRPVPLFLTRRYPHKADSKTGFTLLEVMVGLTIGLILLGGLMELISVSLHYGQRLRFKSETLPVLEAAAETILAFPEKAGEGLLVVESFPGTPAVEVQTARIFEKDENTPATLGELYRVQLNYRGQLLEFSLLVPPQPTP